MSARELLSYQVENAFFGGFPSLRPVQEAAIKPILAGKNVVACSGTGSGKTEAALAPLVSRYWESFEKVDSTLIIYIAPTKALVNDLARRLETPMDKMHLRYGVRHGDKDDLKGRKKKKHIVITTPESLDVMLFREDKALETVRALVIDEVHLLYNTQRGLHLAILIDRLRKRLKGGKLQLVALSATIAKLEEVGAFFFGSDENMELLEYPAHREIQAQVRPGDYTPVVLKLTARKGRKLLAFTNRRKTCEALAEDLSDAEHLRGAVFTHYSSLSAHAREEIEAKFSALETAVCNATSTLELGIDIGDINAVLLCDVPAGTDSFLQRIGRGSRRTNKTTAICFVGLGGGDPATWKEDALRYLALIGAARNGELSSKGTYELFGAIAQQCLSVIASRQEFVSIPALMKTFSKVRHLDQPTLDLIVNGLVERGLLRQEEGRKRYGPTDKLYKLVKARSIYGNFPIKARMVALLHGSEVLSDEIPQFNLEKIGVGNRVVFGARKWTILNITPRIDPEFVEVEPYEGKEPCESFEYRGKGIGFEPFLNEKMWQMIHGEDFPEELLKGQLRKTVTEARESVRRMSKIDQIPHCTLPDLAYPLRYRYYTFGGELINRAVALITKQEHYKEDELWLDVQSRINWKKLPTNPEDYEPVLEKMFRRSPDQSIFQKKLPVELQIREYVQDWLKDDAVPRVLSRLASATTVKITLEEWPFN